MDSDSGEELEELEDLDMAGSYEDMLKQLGHHWIEGTVRHNISIEGASYLWRTAFKCIGKILKKKNTLVILANYPNLNI